MREEQVVEIIKKMNSKDFLKDPEIRYLHSLADLLVRNNGYNIEDELFTKMVKYDEWCRKFREQDN